MVPLKEDGTLDIEKINSLPILDYMNVIGTLSPVLYKSYLLNSPVQLSDISNIEEIYFDKAVERGWVDAEDFLCKIRKRYERS